MGLLDKFERRIEKAVRKPFSGRGGDLQPVELASALRNSVDRNIVFRKDRSIAPNDAAFRFGTAAYEKAYEWGSPLAEELCDVLIRHARSQGYTLPADVKVKFIRDASLPEHEFEVQTFFTDDDGRELPYAQDAARAATPPEEPESSEPAQTPAAAAPAAPAQAPTPGGASAPDSLNSTAPLRSRAARPLDPEPEPEPEFMGVLAVNGQRYAIEGQSVIIGRSSAADIAVPDNGVSRRHVEILNRGGSFSVRDLGSTNGTFLNGFPLETETPLTDGSLLTLSQTRITFRLVEQPRPARPAPQRSRFEPDSPEATS
jgi:pSer/pThr/pTyr-binding forkhead associated (FHA) protein